MTSIIKFQALSGAMEESPHCYLLQVDEFTFLLDCGWDEQCNIEFIKEIKKYIHQVDAVLLSYPDCLHIGSLPYLIGKLGLSCPIYSTIPVYKMGQMFMYDLYQSRHNIENFELFTLDDVDAAFDKIIQLKYNQSVALKGKGYGLTITPLPAGHMIGGTIWKIVKDGEEDILYAVDFNHKKERHLNGCVLESHSRPSLLITDALNATYNQSRRRNRDEQLMTNVLQTLRNNGNVLIAVDTAGRVLELAHMVDQLWRNQESGLMAYSLALLNNVSYNVVEFAKSQIEWMSDKLMRSFEGARNNPFQFKHLQLCHSLQELAKVPSPKVVLASMPDMECGFSRDLFLQWCQSRKNSIVFTSRTSPGTLARNLIDNPSNRTVTLQVKHRVKLEGVELEDYLKKEREKELLNQKQKAKYEVEDMASSEDSEDELDMIVSGKPKHDLLIKSEGKGQMTFFKTYKKAYPMYPFLEERIKCDDYGEIIKIEDYLIKENTIEMEEAIDKIEVKEEEFQDVEIPTKCISHTQTFHIQAQMQYIDFEGRSDGESIRKIISQLKPRRLIIVRGSPESSAYLSNYCSSGISEKVFMPKVHEIIDATTESHIYQVKLKDYLVSSLKFSKGKEADVAWVDGVLSRKREEKTDRTVTSAEDEMEVEEEMKDLIPTLEPIGINEVTGHKSCFINDLKLSDFKQILTKLGIPSEFSAGILWCCNGTVALRRHDAGRITMEGCLSDDYYKVRQLLYDQYAIV